MSRWPMRMRPWSGRAIAAAVQPYLDHDDESLGTALRSFEAVFFNDMILVLDGLFVHRARNVEGKDGNPLNEVRVLCNSILFNGAVVAKDSQIRLDPSASILHLKPGDRISLSAADFRVLAEAYFNEIQTRYRPSR